MTPTWITIILLSALATDGIRRILENAEFFVSFVKRNFDGGSNE